MKRMLEQKVVYRFFLTTVFEDLWLTDEFATVEDARKWEEENRWKLKEASSYPLGGWSLHKVEFDDDGNIIKIDDQVRKSRKGV